MARLTSKLIASGAALALGTYLFLTGVVDLVAILTRPEDGWLLAFVLALFVMLPSALGGLLLIAGWQSWRRARSSRQRS